MDLEKQPENIFSKLGDDLLKSGFASEMRAIQLIRESSDWNCSGAGVYFDRDENITRSVDVHAFMIGGRDDVFSRLFSEYHVFFEVKKSERPWVVFMDRKESSQVGDAYTNPHVEINCPIEFSDLSPVYDEHSIRSQLKWLGYGVHEAFKKPQEAGRWYSAAVTVCKAAHDYLKQEAFTHLAKYRPENSCFVFNAHPVVVIDGPLYGVELGNNNEFKFEKIELAPFLFEFGTDNYQKKTYRVDLVHIEAIPRFLKITEDRQNALYKRLYKELG